MRAMTRDVAEKLLEAFRASPTNGAGAARTAGCHAKTGRKAWAKGLKVIGFPQYNRPFKDILAEEQVEVRARMEAAQREAQRLAAQQEAERRGGAREKALEDVTKQRSQEEALVRSARAATLVLLNNVTNIAAGATALGQKVRRSLEEHAAVAEVLTLRQAKDIVAMVGRLSTSLRQLNDAGQKAMEMSRLLVGEPTKIVGVQHLEGITMAEAKQRVEAAQRAMARLEAKGISVLDGRAASLDPDLH